MKMPAGDATECCKENLIANSDQRLEDYSVDSNAIAQIKLKIFQLRTTSPLATELQAMHVIH